MKLLRGVAVLSAVLTVVLGMSVGSAAPARAAEVMEGVYSYTTADGTPGTWTIYPSCVPVVGDLREPLYLPVACTLNIAGTGGAPSGYAKLVSNLWSFTTPNPEGMKCPDGSWAPTVDTVSFDDATMSGTRSVAHNGNCGMQPGIIKSPFTLAYREPLAMPVDRYPLICEPGGLRRCF
ncbi:hypothetical protein [Mycobacterium sp. SMC-4]|uniref:hypothetical protein n=1 Tax=Mycobacterium sp. SMC-4 TaxID=2857059 RepID=UPI0021B4B25E|nr:hypothetical protein [Mycobacterium sp. SMC-4]UXA16324.1 hypothetical protein KXD98_15955 [Mycobacterium sp. SMC-4]